MKKITIAELFHDTEIDKELLLDEAKVIAQELVKVLFKHVKSDNEVKGDNRYNKALSQIAIKILKEINEEAIGYKLTGYKIKDI